jgi:hypothetical protein
VLRALPRTTAIAGGARLARNRARGSERTK